MFKVRRFQQLENLILESDIIRFEDQFSELNDEFKPYAESQQDTSGDPNAETWKKMDILLDSLLDRGIVDLDGELKDPSYAKQFGTTWGTRIVDAYLDYCTKRLKRLSDSLDEELKKERLDNEVIKTLTITRILVAARVQTIEKIYEFLKSSGQPEVNKFADSVLKKTAGIKDKMSSQNNNAIVIVSEVVKPELVKVISTDTPDLEKEVHAERIITTLVSFEKILPFYGDEAKESAKRAADTVKQAIKEEIGEKRYTTIYETVLSNDQEVQILKRILNLRHQNFTSEDEILKEIDQIKVSINGLEGTRGGRPLSKPEVIAFLKKTLDEEAEYVLTRAREKTITLKDSKGIHFDFKTKLKLYEEVQLPVTGKQIADASWLMKFRKRFTYIANLLPVGSTPVTAAGQAWADLGKQTHKAYAIALNAAGKFIGKMLKGREGEMKGDAITRLFIPDTDVLNEPGPLSKNSVSEEAAPGVAMQVPGSIGSMGPITPPTADSIGSGDNFNQPKKKKKKKTVYEERMEIMNFESFVSKITEIKNDF